MQFPFLSCRPMLTVSDIDKVLSYVVNCEGFCKAEAGGFVLRRLEDAGGESVRELCELRDGDRRLRIGRLGS